LIRGWNRASVFIGFTSICAALLLIDAWLNKRRNSVIGATVISCALVAFSIWDQTGPVCADCIKVNHDQFKDDAEFISAIEKLLPAGSAIYQLPYVRFPEPPLVPSGPYTLAHMEPYDQARGYLQSKTLSWSYGAIKGRRADLFFRALAQEPIALQVEVIGRMGFSAIYLDRRGYADSGTAVETQLKRALGAEPLLISKNGNQVLFDLRPSQRVRPLPAGSSMEQIMQRARFVVDAQGFRDDTTLQQRIDFSRAGSPDFVAKVDGLSGPENWGRWSDADVSPDVELKFTRPLPEHFVLHLRVQAFGPNAGKPVRVLVGAQEQAFVPSSTIGAFSLYFDNTTGSNTIEIHPPQPVSPRALGIGSDDRRLGVGLHSLSIEPVALAE
jgi:phosphoglycerol transferase